MMSTTVPQLSVRCALVKIIGHGLGIAWTIADRVLVMHRGPIVEDGSMEQVLLESQQRERLASELGLHRD
jgi:ABC-type glutathione transport system ATPase component